MTVFDLLFLAAFLASLIALAVAAYASIRGRTPRPFAILRVWLACVAVYLGISVAVAFAAPQNVRAAGEPWCFDDWCLTVEKTTRAPASPEAVYATYMVDLKLSSTAKRITQRAAGAWIYVRDENDRHYEPVADPSGVPLDVVLQPGESVAARRSFQVPANVRELGLVTGHGGGPCGVMSLVIIGGGGCLFHKEAMIRLPLN